MAISEIKMNIHKIKSLRIRNLPSGYFDFFKELDCFENVKAKYLEFEELKYIPLGIFSEWKNPKSDTLIFGSVCY
uniref:Acetyltransferase n=1 Tax=Strongyloides venezuelensis TaxID=75913 RepID=A0A0K0FM67_STRVS